MYVAGATDSQDFPVTADAFQFSFHGDGGNGPYTPIGDGFFTIINPKLTTPVYSTYFGGTMDDQFMGLAFDHSGNVWIVGNTMSRSLPVTAIAAQPAYGGNRPTDGTQGDTMLAKFTALPAAPQPAASVANALNGASFSTAIAPGSLLTIFGVFPGVATTSAPGLPLPDILGGTSVTINGEPAPLNYVNGTQINTQVPWDVAPGLATVIVTTGGLASEPFQASTFQFTVVPAGPGIFTYGANLAVAQNADYTLNSTGDPAKVGSFVIVYMTGGGAVDPTVPTGSATPVMPVSYVKANSSATIGGKPAKVLFLGMAPYFVGIVQADVEIPDLSKGIYPVVVTVGGVKSNGAMVSVSAK
jgi:uncharacterized protein (TIGR03437 family)